MTELNPASFHSLVKAIERCKERTRVEPSTWVVLSLEQFGPSEGASNPVIYTAVPEMQVHPFNSDALLRFVAGKVSPAPPQRGVEPQDGEIPPGEP